MTRTARDISIMLGAFVLATAIAELLGAANLGTAATFGQLAFAAAVAWVILASPSPAPAAAEAARPAGGGKAARAAARSRESGRPAARAAKPRRRG